MSARDLWIITEADRSVTTLLLPEKISDPNWSFASGGPQGEPKKGVVVLGDVTTRADIVDLTPTEGGHRWPRSRYVALAAVFAGVLVLAVVFGLGQRSAIVPFAREIEGASSCRAQDWPPTEISCVAAENKSVTTTVPVDGPWIVRIWLTTVGAVDARLHPRQQVANHPTSPDAPVWMFVYEHASGERLLYVAPAANARPGAFIYVNRFSELGSPETPRTMPTIR